MYILQAAALQKKQKLQDSLDFGTGAAPQREGRQGVTEAAIATEEVTEDQQQEEELKAAAANNNNGDGLLDDCCENEADELLPLKPAAADSQNSQKFGSLLCKRKHLDVPERVELEGEPPCGDKHILFGKKAINVTLLEGQTKNRVQKTDTKEIH